MYTSPWLIRHSVPARPFRLYCFSYAGGNAATYRPWAATLDDYIELTAVQLPGRAERFGEAPISSLPTLLLELARELKRDASVPFAFFGHSVGALIAFELARHCHMNRLPTPQHLFLSGTTAPQYRDASRGLHKMDDDGLISVLKDYNGTPPEILKHRELMELVLPTIRADFALSENYIYDPSPLLDIPLTVLAGKQDDYSSLTQVEAWKETTTNSCQVQWFDGDHFFIQSEQEAVIKLINSRLRDSK